MHTLDANSPQFGSCSSSYGLSQVSASPIPYIESSSVDRRVPPAYQESTLSLSKPLLHTPSPFLHDPCNSLSSISASHPRLALSPSLWLPGAPLPSLSVVTKTLRSIARLIVLHTAQEFCLGNRTGREMTETPKAGNLQNEGITGPPRRKDNGQIMCQKSWLDVNPMSRIESDSSPTSAESCLAPSPLALPSSPWRRTHSTAPGGRGKLGDQSNSIPSRGPSEEDVDEEEISMDDSPLMAERPRKKMRQEGLSRAGGRQETGASQSISIPRERNEDGTGRERGQVLPPSSPVEQPKLLPTSPAAWSSLAEEMKASCEDLYNVSDGDLPHGLRRFAGQQLPQVKLEPSALSYVPGSILTQGGRSTDLQPAVIVVSDSDMSCSSSESSSSPRPRESPRAESPRSHPAFITKVPPNSTSTTPPRKHRRLDGGPAVTLSPSPSSVSAHVLDSSFSHSCPPGVLARSTAVTSPLPKGCPVSLVLPPCRIRASASPSTPTTNGLPFSAGKAPLSSSIDGPEEQNPASGPIIPSPEGILSRSAPVQSIRQSPATVTPPAPISHSINPVKERCQMNCTPHSLSTTAFSSTQMTKSTADGPILSTRSQNSTSAGNVSTAPSPQQLPHVLPPSPLPRSIESVDISIEPLPRRKSSPPSVSSTSATEVSFKNPIALPPSSSPTSRSGPEPKSPAVVTSQPRHSVPVSHRPNLHEPASCGHTPITPIAPAFPPPANSTQSTSPGRCTREDISPLITPLPKIRHKPKGRVAAKSNAFATAAKSFSVPGRIRAIADEQLTQFSCDDFGRMRPIPLRELVPAKKTGDSSRFCSPDSLQSLSQAETASCADDGTSTENYKGTKAPIPSDRVVPGNGNDSQVTIHNVARSASSPLGAKHSHAAVIVDSDVCGDTEGPTEKIKSDKRAPASSYHVPERVAAEKSPLRLSGGGGGNGMSAVIDLPSTNSSGTCGSPMSTQVQSNPASPASPPNPCCPSLDSPHSVSQPEEFTLDSPLSDPGGPTCTNHGPTTRKRPKLGQLSIDLGCSYSHSTPLPSVSVSRQLSPVITTAVELPSLMPAEMASPLKVPAVPVAQLTSSRPDVFISQSSLPSKRAIQIPPAVSAAASEDVPYTIAISEPPGPDPVSVSHAKPRQNRGVPIVCPTELLQPSQPTRGATTTSFTAMALQNGTGHTLAATEPPLSKGSLPTSSIHEPRTGDEHIAAGSSADRVLPNVPSSTGQHGNLNPSINLFNTEPAAPIAPIPCTSATSTIYYNGHPMELPIETIFGPTCRPEPFVLGGSGDSTNQPALQWLTLPGGTGIMVPVHCHSEIQHEIEKFMEWKRNSLDKIAHVLTAQYSELGSRMNSVTCELIDSPEHTRWLIQEGLKTAQKKLTYDGKMQLEDWLQNQRQDWVRQRLELFASWKTILEIKRLQREDAEAAAAIDKEGKQAMNDEGNNSGRRSVPSGIPEGVGIWSNSANHARPQRVAGSPVEALETLGDTQEAAEGHTTEGPVRDACIPTVGAGKGRGKLQSSQLPGASPASKLWGTGDGGRVGGRKTVRSRREEPIPSTDSSSSDEESEVDDRFDRRSCNAGTLPEVLRIMPSHVLITTALRLGRAPPRRRGVLSLSVFTRTSIMYDAPSGKGFRWKCDDFDYWELRAVDKREHGSAVAAAQFLVIGGWLIDDQVLQLRRKLIQLYPRTGLNSRAGHHIRCPMYPEIGYVVYLVPIIQQNMQKWRAKCNYCKEVHTLWDYVQAQRKIQQQLESKDLQTLRFEDLQHPLAEYLTYFVDMMQAPNYSSRVLDDWVHTRLTDHTLTSEGALVPAKWSPLRLGSRDERRHATEDLTARGYPGGGRSDAQASAGRNLLNDSDGIGAPEKNNGGAGGKAPR